jgi:hypothetical protein
VLLHITVDLIFQFRIGLLYCPIFDNSLFPFVISKMKSLRGMKMVKMFLRLNLVDAGTPPFARSDTSCKKLKKLDFPVPFAPMSNVKGASGTDTCQMER